MILDSGKSAEPTAIDLRSPDISPPPSGLELPQAAVMRARAVASTARLLLCTVRRAGLMRTSFRRHLLSATLTAFAGCRPSLPRAEQTVMHRSQRFQEVARGKKMGA